MKIERFGKINEVIPLPPLTEIQVDSFTKALQADVPPSKRENIGLQAAFKETFPIEEGEKGRGLVLDFLEYRLGEPPSIRTSAGRKTSPTKRRYTPNCCWYIRTPACSRKMKSFWATCPS